MKIQIKIAFIFVLLAAGIILLISGSVFYLVNQNLFEDFFKRLELRTKLAANVELGSETATTEAFNELRNEHIEKLPYQQEYFIRIDSTQSTAFQKPDLPVSKSFYKEVLENRIARFRSRETFYTGMFYTGVKGSYIVIVSAQNEFGNQYLRSLRRVLIICSVIAIVLSFSIGLFFSKKVLQPIRSITGGLKNINATNLHLRLPVKDGRDEIVTLSNTINNVLDRLETAFETQNNFVSHASHELNTPLTSIIGEAEYALSRSREQHEYQESLEVIRQSAERLNNIIKSLLHLAQTGFDAGKQQFVRLRMDEMLFKVKKTVDDIIPNNQVYINSSLMPEDESKLVVNGNDQLLELAIANIVLNACKYSSNKPVQIALAATNGHVIIMIRDEGIGIPETELKYIFDPFFRASNTRSFKGYGIGLPLVKNIMRMHKGDINVKSKENQGTEILLEFPGI